MTKITANNKHEYLLFSAGLQAASGSAKRAPEHGVGCRWRGRALTTRAQLPATLGVLLSEEGATVQGYTSSKIELKELLSVQKLS